MKHLQKGQPFVREGRPFQLSERVARSWCGRVAPVAAFYVFDYADLAPPQGEDLHG